MRPMPEYCIYSDLPPAQCDHCRTGAKRSRRAALAESFTEAVFASRCPACGGYIQIGDPLGLVDGEWVCEGCF